MQTKPFGAIYGTQKYRHARHHRNRTVCIIKRLSRLPVPHPLGITASYHSPPTHYLYFAASIEVGADLERRRPASHGERRAPGKAGAGLERAAVRGRQ